jgi:UDP-glucose 4-epimerase
LFLVKVLVTGGAGYIGSVTSTALQMAGHTPIVLDSLRTGPRAFVVGRTFYEGDVADRNLLRQIFEEHPEIEFTIHLAACTVVPESVAAPMMYYRENVAKSLELFDELNALGRSRVVFSSSASVYAASGQFEVDETSTVGPTSPYARTKLITELMLRDLAAAGQLRAVALRYFNPIGADPTLLTGVYARKPSHVVGQLMQVVAGAQQEFLLTGTDHPTRDGTGIRDYVHVWDVARAHVDVIEKFDEMLLSADSGFDVLNVGTGNGVTVRELIAAVERVSGVTIPVREVPARPGDAVGTYANVGRARVVLGWVANHSLDEAIESALRWNERRLQVLGYR